MTHTKRKDKKVRAYERFLKYVSFPTGSEENTGKTPSTDKQLKLAKELVKELREMGIEDARVDSFGYVYASLPANTDKKTNTIGLIAHMDTSPDAPDEIIKPRVVKYKGGDILLNGEKNIYMRVSDYPYLLSFAGEELIVTDGTTLLGADDKAGIAEIMTALGSLINSGAPHGAIKIAFTPDEEIGEGADHFDVEGFGADYAYTVDGGSLGELEYENFNAASARVRVRGVSIHPGSAKDKMKNAARIAVEFDGLLPKNELPELTEGYEGFHHMVDMRGEIEEAELVYIIRDHDKRLFEKKKKDFKKAEKKLNEKYGGDYVTVELRDSYYNMKEIIEENMFTVDRARAAMEAVGITPIVNPIRGGTDGARLSFMGLPCPNLCTGGMNYHSRFEFVSVEAMDKITELIVRILTDAVEQGYAPVSVGKKIM